MSLGFEQAGFDVRAAVEIDPIHAAAHAFNFPRCSVLPESVVGLSAKKIRKAAKLEGVTVDVVCGGAPCQGFSLIGQRAMNDPRNRLVKEFVRIVEELDAKYFVFENVKGLTLGTHKKFLDEIVEAFDDAGYNVRTPWRVLNAASFGVPQNRERLILFGAKRELLLPNYPVELTAKPSDLVDNLAPTPTCEDALEDLPDASKFRELLKGDSTRISKWPRIRSEYARMLRGETNDAWGFGHPRDWDPSILTSSMQTEHTEISRRRFAETPEGEVEPISRFFKLSRNGLSNTLRAGTDASRGAFTSPRPIHYSKPRCVTVREMARLHGFPDWFRFHVTKWHGARQIGNSVPPPMARAVAAEVMRALGAKPRRPTASQALGDPALLSFDMGQAAEYWKVDRPIGKRNMKSGIKKRSQEEIEAQRTLSL